MRDLPRSRRRRGRKPGDAAGARGSTRRAAGRRGGGAAGRVGRPGGPQCHTTAGRRTARAGRPAADGGRRRDRRGRAHRAGRDRRSRPGRRLRRAITLTNLADPAARQRPPTGPTGQRGSAPRPPRWSRPRPAPARAPVPQPAGRPPRRSRPGSTRCPGAPVTSCFGPRWGAVHQGIDFACYAGATDPRRRRRDGRRGGLAVRRLRDVRHDRQWERLSTPTTRTLTQAAGQRRAAGDRRAADRPRRRDRRRHRAAPALRGTPGPVEPDRPRPRGCARGVVAGRRMLTAVRLDLLDRGVPEHDPHDLIAEVDLGLARGRRYLRRP